MRIHSSNLSSLDLTEAARLAGVTFDRFERRGSRSRSHAWDVLLAGSGRRGNRYGNSGTSGAADRKAATWDEWGIFLGELFRRDPAAHVPHVYASGEHFRWVTGTRYDALTPDQTHGTHRWDQPRAEKSTTGAYFVSGCRCGAVLRRLNERAGYTWAAHVEQIEQGPTRQVSTRPVVIPQPGPLGRYASNGRYEEEFLAGR